MSESGRCVVIHAQHLTGVGHYVRARAIAEALSVDHEVWMIEGGRPLDAASSQDARSPVGSGLSRNTRNTRWGQVFPATSGRTGCPVEKGAGPDLAHAPDLSGGRVRSLVLPRIARRDGSLVGLEDGAGPVERVMEARRRILVERVAALRPAAVIVEHYPLSKWDLEEEILAMIAAARAARGDVRVFCSVRDVARQTSHERVAAAEWEERVLARLHAHFDALLVHADPAFTRLEEHFAAADRLRIPVHHTGGVAPPAPTPLPDDHPLVMEITRLTDGQPFVVASVGGGRGDAVFARAVRDAFSLAAPGTALHHHHLVQFTGLDASPAAATESAPSPRIHIRDFSHTFPHWLARARLSISHAGYNTAALLLRTGTPALLVPDPRMSDQAFRAARLAERGLATTISPDALYSLPAVLEALLSAPPVSPASPSAVNLDGATATARLIASALTP